MFGTQNSELTGFRVEVRKKSDTKIVFKMKETLCSNKYTYCELQESRSYRRYLSHYSNIF